MSTKVKAQRSPLTEAPAATLPAVTVIPQRAYLIDKVDEASGEVAQVSRFRYLPGHPRQVRFDAKAGQFNIGGTVPLGNSLSFIPLAWRIFQDDILNMGRKLWAELFYADEKGAVCAVLFHGYSVENLYRLIEPLFYDDLTLADVVVKVTAEKKQTTKEGKTATYYIAQFSYEPAPAEEVAARRDYARDLPIWRAETHTGAADIRIQHVYTVPEDGDPHPRRRAARRRLVRANRPHGARRGALTTRPHMETPRLLIEQPPQDEVEAAQLAQLRELLANADPLPDLRDFAPTVRQLFPEPAYLVGCGSAHIWLHRVADPHRLALIR